MDLLAEHQRHGRPVALDAVVDLIGSLSTRGFCAALLRHLNRQLRVDHCALLRFTPGAGVQLFGAESVASFVARGARAIVSYVDRFHRLDPIRHLLQRPGFRPGVVVQRERPADLADTSYRRACYDEPGIVDRIALAAPDAHGGLIALVMHRRRESGEFGDEDRAALVEVAPLLAAACTRHVELIAHTGNDARTWRLRLASAWPGLTGRELDVAACMMAGRTMREAAAELGIAHSSVVTYSERAYARLGVRNLRELRGHFAGPSAAVAETRAGVATAHVAPPLPA